MTLNREKRGHFNRLRAASHLEADLALLERIKPGHILIVKPSDKGDKYANEVLISLLELTSDCDIVAFRREFAKERLLTANTETLKIRFADFLKENASGFPIAQVSDVELLVNTITDGLKLLVFAEIDVLIGASADEIELIAIDKERFTIQLTSEAVEHRKKLEQDRIEAEKREQERIAALKLEQDRIEAEKREQERIAALKLEQDRIEAEKQQNKERELLEKEEELDKKESDLLEKEEELDEKESELLDKEAEMDNKESEANLSPEKKSDSKKKSTRKSNG